MIGDSGSASSTSGRKRPMVMIGVSKSPINTNLARMALLQAANIMPRAALRHRLCTPRYRAGKGCASLKISKNKGYNKLHPRTPFALLMASNSPPHELQNLQQARPEELPRQSTSGSDSSSEQSHDLDLQDAEQQARRDPSKQLTNAPKENDLLSSFQIFCIIANRMIGTGIFDGATTILQADQSVGGSLLLWALGAVTTVAGTLMYAEYGLTIPRMSLRGRDPPQPVPRSGGELNYLIHLLSWPPFLAACMFGWVFILIGNSAANCLSFAVHILAAAGISSPRTGLVQGIAIGVAWGVLFIHSSGRMFGIHMNTVFATVKIAILVLVIILGFVVLHNHTVMHRDPSSYANLDSKTSFKNLELNGTESQRGYPTAFLSILFTYGGFNQANYVLGEVKKPVRIFKSAALFSVITVSILYMMVSVAYVIVVPLPRDGPFPNNFSVVGEFFKLTIGKAWTEENALILMNTFLAISSLGNVIVTTFTAARVKQEIAKEGVLPWSLFFSRNINITAIMIKTIRKTFTRSSHTDRGQPETQPDAQQPEAQQLEAQQLEAQQPESQNPETLFEPIPFPALCLHGVFTTFLILGTLRVSRPQDSYPFLVGIYSYTIDAMLTVLLSSGLVIMRLQTSSKWNADSDSNRWGSLGVAIIVLLTNLFPIITSWISQLQPEFGSSIPWFVVPTMGWALFVSGLCYWLVFRFVVPIFMDGAVLSVTRTPILRVDNEGNAVQQGELVQQCWEVPEGPLRRK